MILLNFNLFVFFFVYSALCAPETREHYLRYSPKSGGDKSILPLVSINNEQPSVITPIRKRYYTSFEVFYDNVTRAEVVRGPRNYGCYFASEVEPFRSDFFTQGNPLTKEYANTYRKDLRCYALLRPESDVAIGIVLPSGQTGVVVLDGYKGFSSLKASKAMYSLMDISIIEEPKRGLQCRIDLEDGKSIILDAKTRSHSRLSGIVRIGCSYYPQPGRFVFELP